MPTLIGDIEDLDFEVWCSKCGAGLCGNATVKTANGYRGSERIYIEPCEKCLKSERDDGYDRGYSDGIDRTEESDS